MRVPDAHDEASATLAEPIGHNADHARPTCCLEHPAGNLNQVNIELTCHHRPHVIANKFDFQNNDFCRNLELTLAEQTVETLNPTLPAQKAGTTGCEY